MEAIRLDQNGIYINGKYQTLLASSLFYFRIPRERWNDRMKLLKTAGYQAIDVYFPWNYHETAPDVWDFEGNKDVESFLKLAAENELFVIARPGPYICSEWDGGAIPAWLSEKKVAVRQDDPGFLSEMRNWYAHILPVLSKYQIGQQGTIICMQIENELDFYRCTSPVSYMEKLKKMAEEFGMTVPLFYCCGQNDLLRGGGLTPDLYTAYNVYSDGKNPDLEERAIHLYHAVQERSMPFLVTETNREHSYLKRLLACGAKLLSPYNQTAGSTMDFYNGITNWGTEENPVALMASDYDFRSMIGSAGECNEQIYQARLLAGLIRSLGESLATAKPGFHSELSVQSEGQINRKVPFLKLKEGELMELSNLERKQVITVHTEKDSFVVDMKPLETRLLPWNFHIGRECVIRHSNYEIGWISQQKDRTKVCLYGEGLLDCLLDGAEGSSRIQKEMEEEEIVFSYGAVDFVAGSREHMGAARIPGLPDLACLPEEQKDDGKEVTLYVGEAQLTKENSIKAEIAPMESLGQYRGIGCYDVTLAADGEYLIAGAADLLTIRNQKSCETLYSNGNCLRRFLKKGEVQLQTEIWGHSNFDDIRCKSLQMGSLKGISKLMRITRREDISESWLFDLDEGAFSETCFFRHSPYNTIMGIDGYNRAASPLKTIYSRFVVSDKDEDALFLHFEKADCLIAVYVNNSLVSMVQKDDPYVDLSAFAGSGRIELTVRILRRYYTDLAGRVTLLGGKTIKECTYSELLPQAAKAFRNVELPLRLQKGENRFLKLQMQTDKKEVKLFFKGKDLKLTVYAGGHVAGRILLQEENMPVVAGGNRDVVYLCGEWCGDVTIWCQATGERPVLEDLRMAEYSSLQKN